MPIQSPLPFTTSNGNESSSVQSARATHVLVSQVTLHMLRDSNSCKGLLGKRTLFHPTSSSLPQKQQLLLLLVDRLVFASNSLNKMPTTLCLDVFTLRHYLLLSQHGSQSLWSPSLPPSTRLLPSPTP